MTDCNQGARGQRLVQFTECDHLLLQTNDTPFAALACDDAWEGLCAVVLNTADDTPAATSASSSPTQHDEAFSRAVPATHQPAAKSVRCAEAEQRGVHLLPVSNRHVVSALDAPRSAVQFIQPNTQPFGVVSAFSLRTGGVSHPPFDSLNLSYAVGDDQQEVSENRRRFMEALAQVNEVSVPNHPELNPHQVHGIDVISITTAQTAAEFIDAVQAGNRPSADAIVCTVPQVPVLLTFADCVPIILACPGGFAVVHSGWCSTLGKIALHATRALVQACSHAGFQDVHAWIGPHISEEVYEVSPQLISDFVEVFGESARSGERNLNLDACVSAALREAGLSDHQIHLAKACTYTHPQAFFTHRRQGPTTGRIAALAWLIEEYTNG